MSQSQALSMALTLPIVAIAIWIGAIIAAGVVFLVWVARSGGNMSHPLMASKYLVGSFFYRLRYNRKLRRRAYHQSVERQRVPAAPDRVSSLTEQEERFFFLHEAGLEAKVDLNEVNGEVVVTKQEFRRLQEFFTMTSKVSTPHAAFAHHGLTLIVQRAIAKSASQRGASNAK